MIHSPILLTNKMHSTTFMTVIGTKVSISDEKNVKILKISVFHAEMSEKPVVWKRRKD